jgi:signal transduction histidine kinase
MLNEFIITNREEILRRARARVATRTAPQPTREELAVGVPHFLDELGAILSRGRAHSAEMGRNATLHGERRQQMGFTVAQVVLDYGDICQVLTELAIELRAPISTEEFQTLNLCLDDAIAQAVTAYARVRERTIADNEVQRLGFLAHELRDLLNTARLSFEVLKTGSVAIGRSTGAVLDRSLSGLQILVDRTLAQVRLDAGVHHRERVEIPPFLEEMEAPGSIVAKNRGMSLSVERGDAGVVVDADRQLLGSAVSNLLHNGFKFSHKGGHVCLRSSASVDRVVIEVEDQCGGLKPEQIEKMLQDVQQEGRDRSGLGLGLVISKRAIEAVDGTLRVRTNASVGCVFIIDLPRLSTPRYEALTPV